jgi:hypothetical protein
MAEREYTWEEVERRLNRALSRVADNDLRLLEHGPSERAVMHRLAVYLEQEFPEWSTDCEYNRQGDAGDRKQAVLVVGQDAKDVDPDIIIHRRGPDGPNLLAVEVKPADCSKKELEHDVNKLQAYLEPPLSYMFAVFVMYECGDGAGRFSYKPIERPRNEFRREQPGDPR